jgi:hypothetical protein
LERVARIVATLANSGGKHGQPEKLEFGLLVRIADLLRQQPQRSLHSIAVEVAREAYATRRRHLSLESLTSKLERDFRARRHVWLGISRERSGRSDQEEVSQARSKDEHRVLARLIGLMPDAIDIYDTIVMEAKQVSPEEVKRVKALGRTRVELLVENRFEELNAARGDLSLLRKRPRSFLSIVQDELSRLEQGREREGPRSRRVGRKPVK